MKQHGIGHNSCYFEDYDSTGLIYHVASIIDLPRILEAGLRVGSNCSSKYIEFNKYFDRYKPERIPGWVSRKDAVYGSMNFKKDVHWHSHSVILSVRIDEDKCWVGNENLANLLYEPFIMRETKLFKSAQGLIDARGEEFVTNYWDSSLSFKENIKIRKDKTPGYDAEVLIMQDIAPREINIIKIISDHRIMDAQEWNNTFLSLSGAVLQQN